MLLAYLDESYSTDWYYMAALLCDGPGAQAITSALDAAVDKAVKTFGVPENAELHGYELFNGTGWWRGVPVRARIGVYNEAFAAIGSHGAALVLRGMNVAHHRHGALLSGTPHQLVLRHLLERIDECADQRGEHVLVIADEVGEQSKHRADLHRYLRHGTHGSQGRRLTRIVDTMHFAPSSASRLVQAIDLVVFLYRRRQTHVESDERATRANTALWARIEPKISHQECWFP
ncbi:DUF3800 domain-containing protein [Actinoplanes sp. NBRC 101535]|uniref:DUF3800 domain-containing protein n=1 Tax=Actinoplanes sp. NBRC 101535 TaxID=3032196 RepID=UPI0024A23BA6|nr:DUF3800 domain-containing protein [Actinoplanes sp. NBRC 101535]GLY01845.1 hypothetical protein Acsp01_22240 [Actinoplanes sp. NBRC 101535]